MCHYHVSTLNSCQLNTLKSCQVCCLTRAGVFPNVSLPFINSKFEKPIKTYWFLMIFIISCQLSTLKSCQVCCLTRADVFPNVSLPFINPKILPVKHPKVLPWSALNLVSCLRHCYWMNTLVRKLDLVTMTVVWLLYEKLTFSITVVWFYHENHHFR